MAFDSRARDLVCLMEDLQSFLKRLQLVKRWVLHFKVTHDQNAEISGVFTTDMSTLVLKRTALPNVSSTINGKVIADAIPVFLHMVFMDLP